MKTLISDKSKCCSCGNCCKNCPKHAITMSADERGFYYPEINENLCVDCGICQKCCPMTLTQTIKHDAADCCYSLISDDKYVLNRATSGGAFITLVKAFFKKGEGLVCGAEFTKELKCVHSLAATIDDCYKFCKSKYIKSDLGDCFEKIKKVLDNGTRVLFSGTPCQVAALYAYLGKEYLNLVTIDFVCNGTPSQKIFDLYLTSSYKNIANYEFRYKSETNSNSRIRFYDGTEKILKPHIDDYLRAYYANLLQSELCFECPFTDTRRCADITLGDFWGLNIVNPNMEPRQGISLVIVNTERGRNLFEVVDNADIEKYSINVAINGNPRLSSTPVKCDKIDVFLERLKKHSFHKAVVKTLGKPQTVSKVVKIKIVIKRVLHKIGVQI